MFSHLAYDEFWHPMMASIFVNSLLPNVTFYPSLLPSLTPYSMRHARDDGFSLYNISFLTYSITNTLTRSRTHAHVFCFFYVIVPLKIFQSFTTNELFKLKNFPGGASASSLWQRTTLTRNPRQNFLYVFYHLFR